MHESRTSGSVGGEGGNILVYPAVYFRWNDRSPSSECALQHQIPPEASVDCHWFAMNFGPYVRHVLQHSDKTTFETIFRNFPATRAFYFDQDHGNDVNKGLQGCTSLLGFLVVIAGCWKEVIDAINNVIAENENLFVSLHCHGQVPRGKKRRRVSYLTRNGC
jgi:hypothetical protein